MSLDGRCQGRVGEPGTVEPRTSRPRRVGDATGSGSSTTEESVVEKIPERQRAHEYWEQRTYRDGDCWRWSQYRDRDGYGRFGRGHLAHREAYKALVGPIPQGLTLDHLCRNRDCVNPAHLEPVTIGENLLRGESFQGVNARKTHCINGHPFDETNTRVATDFRTGRPTRECRTCTNRRTAESRKRRLEKMGG